MPGHGPVYRQRSSRLLVASANLTTSGYRENREVVLSLTATRKDPERGSSDSTAARTDARAARAVVEQRRWNGVRARASRVLGHLDAPATLDIEVTWFWGGGRPALIARCSRSGPATSGSTRQDRIPRSGPGRPATDHSRPRLHPSLERNASIPEAQVLLIADASPAHDEFLSSVALESYRSFRRRQARGARASVIAAKPEVDVGDDEGRRPDRLRRLHAKVLLLEESDGVAYAGSANFSIPGWGFGRAVDEHRGRSRATASRQGREQLRQLIPPTHGSPVALNGRSRGQDQHLGRGGRILTVR